MQADFLHELPLDKVICHAQVRQRFAEESLAGLTQSLREVGLLQPIRVRRSGDTWIVLDGERRVRAARMAGWVTIAAVVEEQDLTDREVIQRQLIANCQREDLAPVEKARAVDRLMKDAGWNEAQVAVRLGLSPATISKLLALLLLPKEVQERVDGGELAASTAYEIVKIRDPLERAKLFAQATAGGLTRDEVVARSRESRKTRKARGARRPRAAEMRRVRLMLGGRRSVTVAGPEMNLASLTAWAEELLARLRSLADPEMTLDAAVKALNAERKDG